MANWSLGGILIQDARSVLNSFATWLASHVKREANQMAHLLAKDVLKLEFDMYTLEYVSDCIEHVVNMDYL